MLFKYLLAVSTKARLSDPMWTGPCAQRAIMPAASSVRVELPPYPPILAYRRRPSSVCCSQAIVYSALLRGVSLRLLLSHLLAAPGHEKLDKSRTPDQVQIQSDIKLDIRYNVELEWRWGETWEARVGHNDQHNDHPGFTTIDDDDYN